MKQIILLTIFLVTFIQLVFASSIVYNPPVEVELSFSNKNYSLIHSWDDKSFEMNYIISIDGVEYESKDSLKEYKKYNNNAKINKIKKTIKQSVKGNGYEWGWELQNIEGVPIDYGIIEINKFVNINSSDFVVIPQYGEIIENGKTYKNISNIVNYKIDVNNRYEISMKTQNNVDCDIEYLGDLKFKYVGNMEYCLDPITFTGGNYVITGYKLDTQIDGAGTYSGGGTSGSWVNFSTDLFEETIVATGTASGTCLFHDGNANRDAVTDPSASFTTEITQGLVEYNVGEDLYGVATGYYTDTAYRSNIFDNYGCNDDYIIYGFNVTDPDRMDTNLLVVMNGSGVKQVKAIKITLNNTLFLYGAWETVPEKGDRIVILWSPADIVNNFPSAGTLTTMDRGRRIAHIEIDDNTRIGDGVTETGYGWAGYTVSLNNIDPEGTGWTQVHRRYSNSAIYVGEWNPLTKTYGKEGYMDSYSMSAYSTTFMQEYLTTDQDSFQYASCTGAGDTFLQFGGGTTESHSFKRGAGNEISINDETLGGGAIETSASYYEYRGGNWDEPLAGIIVPAFNYVIRGTVGRRTTDQIGTRGFGWHWGNTGDPTTYWMRFVDVDADIEGYANALGESDQSAWFQWDNTDMDEAIYWSKSFYRPIVDENGEPIENATVTIYNNWNEIVSYFDSGSELNEFMSTIETLADVTNCHNLTAGKQYMIDREFINISVVPNGVAPYNCTTTWVRGNIHEHGYNKDQHRPIGYTGYDPTIWEFGSVTTDENGLYPEQLIDIGYWNYDAHQVYHNGVYYTANTGHLSSSANEPPNAVWSVGGTEKIKWLNNTYYYPTHSGGATKSSIKNLNPIKIIVEKDGYYIHEELLTMGMDNQGYKAPIVLREQYCLDGTTKISFSTILNNVCFEV